MIILKCLITALNPLKISDKTENVDKKILLFYNLVKGKVIL